MIAYLLDTNIVSELGKNAPDAKCVAWLDVHLNWRDISDANVETRQFGIWKRSMFRLQVRTVSSDYWSLWIGSKEEAKRAQDVIQTHLSKPQKSESN